MEIAVKGVSVYYDYVRPAAITHRTAVSIIAPCCLEEVSLPSK